MFFIQIRGITVTKQFFRGVLSFGLILLIAGCTGAQMRQGAIVSKLNNSWGQLAACIKEKSNSSNYDSLKLHVNFTGMPSYENLNDKAYISKEELIAFKNLHNEIRPCTKDAIDGLIAAMPELALPLIKLQTSGANNRRMLFERSITWGQFNQNLISAGEKYKEEARVIGNRYDQQFTIEHNQELAVRQQIFQAMTAYAQAVNQANAATYANRPVMTTCRNVGGWTSCISN